MQPDNIDVNQLKQDLNKFITERDWQKAHTIKNVVMNLSVEANELQEIFVWHNDEEINQLIMQPDVFEHIRQEIGDVLMTTIMLADQLGINVAQAIEDKLEYTKRKYPAKGISA